MIRSLTVLCLFVGLGQAAVAADSFQPIFDGKSLDGWRVETKGQKGPYWVVEDGILVAENPDKSGSNLWTTSDYRDFELELDYKTTSDYYDTGVFLRSGSHQVQIGISGSLKRDMTGCIYAPKDGRGKYPGQTDKIDAHHKVGDWNRLRIVLQGKRIQTFLNGEPFVDYTGDTIPAEGPIGLQLHAGHHMNVQFRDVQIKPLSAE